MSWIRRFALFAIIGCLLAIVPSSAFAGRYEHALIHKVNQQRAAYGLRALKSSGSLNHSARSYVRMMLARRYFGHLSQIRMSRKFHRRGEVLAQTRGRRPRPAVAVAEWMASPMHHAVLMDGGFSYIGVGRAYGSFGGKAATGWVAQLGS